MVNDNPKNNDISSPLPAPPPHPIPSPPSRWQRFWAFPVTRIVLYLLVSAALAFALSLALNGLLHLRHHRRSGPVWALILLGETLTAASAVGAFWIMVRFADKRPWATAGYSLRALPTQLGGGFALGAAMLTVGVGILAALGVYHVRATVPSVLIFAPLGLYLCVAIFEETFFRGYIFQTLEGRWGSGAALVTTSLLFGLAHLANPVPGASAWMRVAGPLQICLEAGLPLSAAYLLTRRWWLPIGIHWAWDYCEGPIYGCPDSGTHDPHTLLHAALSGPALLTGGPFGPEAGLPFLLVGTLTGVLLLRAAVRRGQWQARPRSTASRH